MKIEVEKDSGGVVLLKIEGEIDMHSSPDVRNALLPYFNSNVTGIVVDLSGVKYMDSSGIATMIEGLQWASKEGSRFVLAGMSDTVMDVFVLTNLSKVFEFSADSETAYSDITGG
jgi:anti-sigma B factor antagonist